MVAPRARPDASQPSRLGAGLRHAGGRLLGLVLIAMTLINVANAATRYLLGFQIAGSDELLTYGQVWLVMLGLVAITAGRRHLALDLFAELGPLAQALRRLVIDALFCVTAAYAAWHSYAFVARMWQYGSTSMGLGVPMVVPHLAVLVGFAATAVVAAGLLGRDLRELARARLRGRPW